MARKNKHKSVRKRNKKFFSSKLLLTFIVFFAIILIFFIFLQVGLIERIFSSHETLSFIIEDNCGVILGNLLHEIKNEADCSIRCHNDCGLRGLDYLSVNFSVGNESCYSCTCYCD